MPLSDLRTSRLEAIQTEEDAVGCVFVIVAEIRHLIMWAERRDRDVQDSVGGLSASLTPLSIFFYSSCSVSASNGAVDEQTTGTFIHPSIHPNES